MRARSPDHEGTVDRDGVPIHYEVHGSGDLTLLLVPPSPITHSRMYKGLVPHLARRHRVVTVDGRGNGRSGRPTDPGAHSRAANEADIVAVLDAVGAERAVLVAHCHANWWTVDLAATQPDRVSALVALSPGVPFVGPTQPHWAAMGPRWHEEIADPEGWELYTRAGVVGDHRRWVEFFFEQLAVEPHSTKQYEDMVAWALETTGEVLVAGEEGIELDLPDAEAFRATCRALRLPILVVHGEEDVCQSVERGRAFTELTGAELVVVPGRGHLLPGRDPVKVNRAITDFLDRRLGAGSRPGAPATRAGGGRSTRPRALFLSSPIGLGHARRDVAIARELQQLVPDLEVDWLAQDPVTRVLDDERLRIHPASTWLANESAHVSAEASGHHLHCFQALRRMDEILAANFMVFQDVIEGGGYDVVIGDEAWDVDHFWHENPGLKRGAHVWLTDFVGFLPMAEGGGAEAGLTADHNAEMLDHIDEHPRIRDRSLFVGNPGDVVSMPFGPDLPDIRDWTERHFDFTGYITGFTPPTPEEVEAWRSDLGWHPDEQVVVVTVGGSGVGAALLRRVVEAFPLASRAAPGLRMVAVTGPRIDPASLPEHPGLEVRGYVERLYRCLAACDLGVVQGGLTTTMELTAANRPFLSFPLAGHFEQQIHVRHRLDQYGAGRSMDFAASSPEVIAAAIAEEVGREVAYRPVERDGAARAAAAIAELL
jgi:pimeloyl-ACP methyl ester carboxylesterase/predicted glycosyltransferase